MFELNRLVEIYMYYYNMDMGNPYNLATELIESIKAKSNISPREYIAKIEERKMMEQEQEKKLCYIEYQTCSRLGEGVLDFYGMIDKRIDMDNPVDQAIEKVLRSK